RATCLRVLTAGLVETISVRNQTIQGTRSIEVASGRRDGKSWFGGECIFRWVAVGRPKRIDSSLKSGVALLEERVILVRAANSGIAIQLAEAEARSYAEVSFRNPYDQQVRTTYLEACDCYALTDAPGHLKEVYSSTDVVTGRRR